MRKRHDLLNRQFGRLTVVEKCAEQNSGHRALWKCICSCGNITKVTTASLVQGTSRSCGCLRKDAVRENTKESKTTHGATGTPEYEVWKSIKQRCYNPKNDSYRDYGGRGILMSEEWKDGFENFIADMGLRPSVEFSIERKDNNKGYSKENCVWATRFMQANNKRTSILYEFDGERKTLAEWCRELGLSYRPVWRRIKRGMVFEDALDDVIKAK